MVPCSGSGRARLSSRRHDVPLIKMVTDQGDANLGYTIRKRSHCTLIFILTCFKLLVTNGGPSSLVRFFGSGVFGATGDARRKWQKILFFYTLNISWLLLFSLPLYTIIQSPFRHRAARK
ncbi:uncharacterized protein LAESUDRAFT_353009 [Laetiporus sulphureus 93-53]|uniref:Uncharacterized protein n=1 Tax=Laetiporus sulphureus 93-53 TaxID=1314785 RepID=A0A165GV51_9APHY|nr:uncharacterized protein LAESUDRAFT_353009 [Laetiporus sulphureus 93-53]KZT10859.1 hypothetical protein LAESUDRAFT_353009 [Laetiporus sulphureus 93-53]